MKRTVIVLIAASALLMPGCDCDSDTSSNRPGVRIEETTPAVRESTGTGTTFEREVVGLTFGDLKGPSATEVVSRLKGMEIDSAGGFSSGGSTWSWIDSFGTWLVAGVLALTTAGVLMTLIGAAGSVFSGTGAMSSLVGGIAQLITFPIPLLGAIVQRMRGNVASERFQQVVTGGDAFKAALEKDATLKPTVRDHVWQLFKQSQRGAQDTTTQAAVQAARG